MSAAPPVVIKVCGITTLRDAEMSAEAGATAIGFNFYRQSPRYIEPSEASRIAGALGSAVLKTGIFVDESPQRIQEIAAQTGLDVVQLHGTSRAQGLRVWRACRAGANFSESMLDDESAEAFLLDTPSAELHGGTGRTFDWSIARGLRKKIILAGGLDASNVREAIETARPWGVDACSRLELEPGRKDPAKVREFVKAASSL